jgi:hypothetical protein
MKVFFTVDQGCQIFIGTKYQNGDKYTKLPQNKTNDHKVYQMTVKFGNLENFTSIWYILWHFGIFYEILYVFRSFDIFSPFWYVYQEKSEKYAHHIYSETYTYIWQRFKKYQAKLVYF